MTCRDEVTAAFETLRQATGRVEYAPIEILEHMRASGSIYKDSTIRTHVTAHMVDDGTLVKGGPSRYRLARHRHEPAEWPPSKPEALESQWPKPTRPSEGSADEADQDEELEPERIT